MIYKVHSNLYERVLRNHTERVWSEDERRVKTETLTSGGKLCASSGGIHQSACKTAFSALMRAGGADESAVNQTMQQLFVCSGFSCPICHEPWAAGEQATPSARRRVLTPCGHHFHLSCLNSIAALRKDGTKGCPTCNTCIGSHTERCNYSMLLSFESTWTSDGAPSVAERWIYDGLCAVLEQEHRGEFADAAAVAMRILRNAQERNRDEYNKCMQDLVMAATKKDEYERLLEKRGDLFNDTLSEFSEALPCALPPCVVVSLWRWYDVCDSASDILRLALSTHPLPPLDASLAPKEARDAFRSSCIRQWRESLFFNAMHCFADAV